MREKHPSTKKDVWPMPREAFETLQKRSIDSPRAKLVNKLVIVDRQLLPIARDGTLHVPGRNDLLVRRRGVCGLDRAGWPCGCGGTAGLQRQSGDEESRIRLIDLPDRD